jgi:hypothetical protein
MLTLITQVTVFLAVKLSIATNQLPQLMGPSGTVAVKICINQAGIVTFAEINNTETSVKDQKILKNFLGAARNYRFSADKSAPKRECGKLLFKIENSINN